MSDSSSPLSSRTRAAFGPDALRLSSDEFEHLRAIIYDACGIHIPDARKYLLENRLRPRLEELGLSGLHDYLPLLKKTPGPSAEITHLFELITTNETSFFRDTPQLEVFREQVLAPMLRTPPQGRKELNIWCAGCSSGEEPYTLAMMVANALGGTLPAWKVHITANDLSLRMLEAAKTGEYTDYALRTTPEAMKRTYFKPAGEGLYSVVPKIRELVSFHHINLNDAAALRRVPQSHIIFCRNVIIYFDADMKKRVVESFYDNLMDGCYLVLGHSESLHRLSRSFEPVRGKGGIVYKKLPQKQEAG